MADLFKEVHYIKLKDDNTFFGYPWVFWHTGCGEIANKNSDPHIRDTGKCRLCGKFILPYKKLVVMAALKELND